MNSLAPPPAPPLVTTGDNDGLKRLRFRLMQILATLVTVLVTAWFCTLGAIPAILALMVAKHVLVAILVMGLGVDSTDSAAVWGAAPARRPTDFFFHPSEPL